MFINRKSIFNIHRYTRSSSVVRFKCTACTQYRRTVIIQLDWIKEAALTKSCPAIRVLLTPYQHRRITLI